MADNIYHEKGFKDRDDYLQDLAASAGVHIENVKALADLLGPGEDFDGLVTAIEDI
jgi:hypothetical protein